jgi:hypothetical protein
MSLSNSRLSYVDCFDLLNRALDEPRGIRVEVPSLDAAIYLRMRIHHARQIDRNENRSIYPDPGHYLHGRSIYDIFVIRVESGPPAWLYLDKQKVEIGRVESIPETKVLEAPQALLMIEGPKVQQPTAIPAKVLRR